MTKALFGCDFCAKLAVMPLETVQRSDCHPEYLLVFISADGNLVKWLEKVEVGIKERQANIRRMSAERRLRLQK